MILLLIVFVLALVMIGIVAVRNHQ